MNRERGTTITAMTMERALMSFFLASVFLLALCRMEDPDAWLHLTYGRLVWEVRGMAATEPYVYSMLGKPFLYTSWLFGLLYYGVFKLFGLYGIALLKATIITLVFSVLVSDSLRPHADPVLSVLILTGIVLISRHRFTERPDTFLMLFLSFSVFALNAFVHDNKKYLYALPFVHLLWANSHTSINLMFLPFAAFLAGGALQEFLFHKQILLSAPPSRSQRKMILFIGIASFCASLLNPNFIQQYALGAHFLGNDWFRQNIGELQPPAWAIDKEFYVLTALVLLSFLLSWRRFSFVHFALLLPVIFLAFTTRRFIYVFFILSGPVLVRNIAGVLKGPLVTERLILKRTAMAGVFLLVVLSTTLTLAKVGPFGNLEKEFGPGVNNLFVPEGALRYMDEKKITGRVLNAFQWGQYIIWRDFPKRSVIVDGRCNVPVGLLRRITRAPADPALLDELYTTYGFEAILIDYDYEVTRTVAPAMSGPFDARLSHPGWALVYWDDISLLYVKRDGKYAPLVRDDEYRYVKPANNIFLLVESVGREGSRPGVISELQRNVAETGSLIGNLYLGHVYNLVGRYQEAIECFSRVKDHPLKHYLYFAYKGIAYAYDMLGDYPDALSYYERSLRQKDDAGIHSRIDQLHQIMVQ